MLKLRVPVFRYISDREAIIALLVLSPVLFTTIFAQFVAPFNPLQSGVGPSLSPPSSGFPMGTDQLGGDLFSQLVYGSRVAIYVGVVSTAASLSIAILLGLPAGYFRGIVDEVLMRFTDLVLSIPSFLLIIFLVVMFGNDIQTITTVIGIVSWPTMARIVRAETLSIREREFVLAAKAVGAGPGRIMFGEILPNVWLPLIPAVTLQIGAAILLEAGLSFLGLGDTNVSSWGRMLWLANSSIFSGDWWGIFFPGLAITGTILGFNMLGDALGKILNPRGTRK